MTTILIVSDQIGDYTDFVSGVEVPVHSWDSQFTSEDIQRIGFVWDNNKKIMPFGSTKFVNTIFLSHLENGSP